MPDRNSKTGNAVTVQDLQAEIERLQKVIQALMNRAEREANFQNSDYNLFQQTLTLEQQVRRSTAELENALQANEKITRHLRESEGRFRTVVENSPLCIHEIDLDGRLIWMNRAGLEMLGIASEMQVRGQAFLNTVSEQDIPHVTALFKAALEGNPSHFEFTASGQAHLYFKSCFIPIKNVEGNVLRLMGLTENITQRKEAEAKINNLAFFDPLTQLPNRRLLNDRLGQALAGLARSGSHAALMFLDMDNFKPLNDQYGHTMGDKLLLEVAQRIKRCVREMDTVARFGGDEFVVLLSELGCDKDESIQQALNVATKIRLALASTYRLHPDDKDKSGTIEHHCTASIGVVVFPPQSDKESIFKWADAAMYQAKESGRNNVRLYEPKA